MLNRNLLLLTILLLSPLFSTAQSIKELFLSCPEPIIREVPTRENRKQFLENSANGQRAKMIGGPDQMEMSLELKVLDVSAGYLEINDGDTFSQMVYWKKRDGSLLVGISNTATHMVLESEASFFSYDNGTWTKLKTDSILQDFSYIDVLDIRATLAANNGKAIPIDGFSYATYIKLPQKGKDIQVVFELVDMSDRDYGDYEIVYKDPNRRENLSLIWNDGTFLKE